MRKCVSAGMSNCLEDRFWFHRDLRLASSFQRVRDGRLEAAAQRNKGVAVVRRRPLAQLPQSTT
jgi:hypothetical protein